MAVMCSAPSGTAAGMPTTRAPSMPADATMLGFIAATAGVDGTTTAITQAFGTIRDFMGGASIPGECRLPGALGHGDGEERRGGDFMADGGILIPCTLRRTTG